MSTKQIYIAGPMSGYPEWNYPAFMEAAHLLRSYGWSVKNPAEKDMEEGYDDPEAKKTGDTALSIANGSFPFRKAFLWDVQQVLEGDAIYMLKGWEFSPGACAEHAVAVVTKKNYPEFRIIYEGDSNLWP